MPPPVDHFADADLDSFPAWQEFMAVTHPTNPQSFLRVIDFSQAGSNIVLSWLGGTTGYQGNWSMGVSSNLTDWIVLESKTIPRNPSGTKVWEHTNGVQSAGSLFYRPCIELTQ